MADLKNDIDKYLKGELGPAEMHALEKKALSDPFLADALEGAGEIHPPQFEADLRDLQHALQQRIGGKEEKKVVSLWVWSARIAAGLAVVAVASIIIFQLSQRNKREDLSMIQDKETAPAPPKEELPAAAEEEKSLPSQEPTVQKPNPIVSRKDREAAPVVSEEPASGVVSNDEPLASELEESAQIAKTESATQSAPATKPEEKAEQYILKEQADDALAQSSDTKRKRAIQSDRTAAPALDELAHGNLQQPAADSTVALSKALQGRAAGVAVTESKVVTKPKVVTGKVTGEDGEGLPGVNVMIKGSSIGTVTDATGDYQITLQENDKLVFSYIGYTGQEADTKKDKVDVQMDVDAAQLSEVVVVGYEPAFDKDEERAEALELASPEGGRRAFKQYLEKNLLYPQQAIENKVEGRVTIQFTVESTGLLSDFSVLKGIGSGCDEEVIRLVRQGPKWFPTKRSNEAVRDRVKVRMKFVLPKK
jgi:TonB family protein